MSFYQQLQEAFTGFYQSAIAATPSILAGLALLVAFVIMAWFMRYLSELVSPAQTRRRKLYGRVLQTAIILIGVFLSLSVTGINLTGLLTGLGLVTVGLSFSLQDVLVNFIAGLQLLGQAPFELGDLIVVGEQCGIVRDIGTRALQLEGDNGANISIPNRDLLVKSVQVLARKHDDKLSLPLEVARATDLGAFGEQLRTALDKIPGVMPGTTTVSVEHIGVSALKLTVTVRLARRRPPRGQVFGLAYRTVAELLTKST